MEADHQLARGGQLRLPVTRVQGGRGRSDFDEVVREDALQLLVDSEPLAIVMRTPGSDLELCLGLLHAEGMLPELEDLAYVRISPSGQLRLPESPLEVRLEPEAENLVDIHLRRPLPGGPVGWQRALPSTSACGICGSATLDALRRAQDPVGGERVWPAERLFALPEMLSEAQRMFRSTGGLHAAGLIDWDEAEMRVAEDVGRHNAVDKLVGAALLEGRLPLTDACLMVSGRAGFEIVQKAAAAQVAVVASISAPSSLAVQAAEATGVTLVGFLRGDHCNVYSHPRRVGAALEVAGR